VRGIYRQGLDGSKGARGERGTGSNAGGFSFQGVKEGGGIWGGRS
jgi:hypothetical protein